MISQRTIGGVKTTTIEEGDWRYQRVGWGGPWVVTHVPSGTVVEHGKSELPDVKQAVRTLRPDLCAEVASTARYDVVRGRMSTARPGRRRTQ